MFQTKVEPETAFLHPGRDLLGSLNLQSLSRVESLDESTAKALASSSGGFPANNVVPFDDGSHTHARIAVLNPWLDAQNFSRSSYQHFSTACDFRRQSQDQVES